MGKTVRVVILLIVLGVVAFVGKDPALAKYYNSKGVSALNASDYHAAVVNLDKAVRHGGGNATVRFNLGQAYELTGDPERAKENYQMAADAGHAEAKAKLATVGNEVDLKKRALARVERMKAAGWKAEPDVTVASILATVSGLEALGNWKDANVLLERVLFLDPTNLDIEQRIEDHEEYLRKGGTL